MSAELHGPNPIALTARAVLEMGYQPVLVEPCGKKPTSDGWQKIRYTAHQDLESVFTADHNLGLLLGASKLVDADLDSPWARALADCFLPKSTMVWGRQSEPASHRAYRVKSASAVKYKKYVGILGADGQTEVTLLERRSGSHQSVVPPSIHKDTGEKIQWVAPGPASEVDATDLCRAFDRLAAASLIASIWHQGLRHKLALAVSGFLLKAGCSAETVQMLLEPVVQAFDDEQELGDRMKAIEDTVAAFEKDPATVSGASALNDIVPEYSAVLMTKLSDWLGLRPGSDSDIPVINIFNRSWGDIADEAYKVLIDRNQKEGEPPALFQMADRLARVRVDEDARPKIQVMSDPALRGRLAREVLWVNDNGEYTMIVQPPDFVVKDIQARKEWPRIPALRGIVESPVFTKEGAISVIPGYQPTSRVWFHAGDVDVPEVSLAPNDDEIARAKSLLLDDLLVDFPFDCEASRVHALAMLLLPVLRELIPGPTPPHGITASTPGSGKGLLTTVASRIHTGRGPEMVTPPRTEEEWRKLITSMLMAGPPMITFDNVSSKLDSAALAAVLTAEHHRDRVLGVTALSPVLPNRALWVFTGNNITTSNEIARRFVWIRLLPNVENPHLRSASEFKHHPLEPWVRLNRGELLWALLTLGQAWVAKGRTPYSGTRVKGTYEEWTKVVGGVLDAAGLGGEFLGNDEAMFGELDTEMAPWRDFVTMWAIEFGSRAITTRELLLFVRRHGLLTEELPDDNKGDRSHETKLGALLRKYKDRVIAGWRLRSRTGRLTSHSLEPVSSQTSTADLSDVADLSERRVA